MLIVITGAQGFLGRHVVARLAAEGHNILAVDRRPSVETPIKGVQYHVSDLIDPATLIPPECEPVGEIILIHLAWDLRSRETSYKVQSEQVTLLAGLLDTWTNRGLKYVVVPGSAQEYGGRGGVIREDDLPVEPLSPYGWAKRSAYEMTASWARQSGVGLLWLRPFIIYGPGQAGSMLVPYAVRQGHLKLPAQFSDGLQHRDFVYVDDVVDAISAGCSKLLPGVNVINLGCGVSVKIRDVLEWIGKEMNALNGFAFGKRTRRSNEPDEQIADIIKAEKVLGWKPKVDWQTGMAKIINEIKKAGS